MTKLFLIPKPNPHATLRLFCFPYAGGAPNIFMPWLNKLPNNVELVLIQLPGRGARLMEAPHNKMSSIIDELMLHSSFITQKPNVFFGHSLGSRVAYELALTLQKNNLALPQKLIASGSRAPHLENHKTPIYHLPESEFITKLRELNGTPKEVLDNAELMELFLPLLRADFEIADCYQTEKHPLPVPIDVFFGHEDIDVTPPMINAWQALSALPITQHAFNGDHFFINSHSEQVIKAVSKLLNSL
ncbi:thioesterase II family protein [Pseudoalteromonas umbrosa]|uniref:thioesterase II family protein n=1 Tax=Pseudoalteromonas umbrosa TaxID=3048489 RepID=UPI0024C3DFC2|nr:thioesterase domain-containing protein [Pseudoalteromonas sp. B95]MDK1288560.1 thioesterase domain-containing protein [Pseudoalteromonas sp. B95]